METIILLKRIFFFLLSLILWYMRQRSLDINQITCFFFDDEEKTIEIHRCAPLIYEEEMNRKKWVDNWILFLLSEVDDRCIQLMKVIYFTRWR